jgi:hypothetical protein
LKRARGAALSAHGAKGTASTSAPIARSISKRRKTKPTSDNNDDDSDELKDDVTNITDAYQPPMKKSATAGRRSSRRRNNAGAAKSPPSFDWFGGLSDDDGQSPALVLSSSDHERSALEPVRSLLSKAGGTGVEEMETDSMGGEDDHEIIAPEGSESARRKRSRSPVNTRETDEVSLKKARVDSDSIDVGASDTALDATSAPVAPMDVGARYGGSSSASSADDDDTSTVIRPLHKGSVVGIYAGRGSEEPFFLGTVIVDPSTSEEGSVDIQWMELNMRNQKYEIMDIDASGAWEPVYRASILADGLTLVDGRLRPSDAELVMEVVLGGVTKEDAAPDGYDIVSRADFESLLDHKHISKVLRSKHILIHSMVTGYESGRIDTCTGTTVEGIAGATVGIRYPFDPNDPSNGVMHSAKKWRKSWFLAKAVHLFKHTYSVPSLSKARPGWVLLSKKK